jgi:hypothetical protein
MRRDTIKAAGAASALAVLGGSAVAQDETDDGETVDDGEPMDGVVADGEGGVRVGHFVPDAPVRLVPVADDEEPATPRDEETPEETETPDDTETPEGTETPAETDTTDGDDELSEETVAEGLEFGDVVALAHDFSEALGKETWESDDKPGFVSNRILMPWINEGIRAFDEGVATKEDIDRGMKLGTNVPMGPLELADHIGLDICLDTTETLHEELGDRYKPAYLLKRKVDAGDLGKKTGKGFYEYD